MAVQHGNFIATVWQNKKQVSVLYLTLFHLDKYIYSGKIAACVFHVKRVSREIITLILSEIFT